MTKNQKSSKKYKGILVLKLDGWKLRQQISDFDQLLQVAAIYSKGLS